MIEGKMWQDKNQTHRIWRHIRLGMRIAIGLIAWGVASVMIYPSFSGILADIMNFVLVSILVFT